MTINSAREKAIDIEGLPEAPISGLRLTNIVGTGRTGLTARYTDDLELHNVRLNPAPGAGGFQGSSADNGH